jgi:hypothetical protein
VLILLIAISLPLAGVVHERQRTQQRIVAVASLCGNLEGGSTGFSLSENPPVTCSSSETAR